MVVLPTKKKEFPMDFQKLKNLLIGGAIVSQKSGVLIQDIDTVEDKWFGVVVGGQVANFNWNGTITWERRYTTIDLSEY
jgi:hypothetical protein